MHDWFKSYGNVLWLVAKGIIGLLLELAQGGFVTNDVATGWSVESQSACGWFLTRRIWLLRAKNSFSRSTAFLPWPPSEQPPRFLPNSKIGLWSCWHKLVDEREEKEGNTEGWWSDFEPGWVECHRQPTGGHIVSYLSPLGWHREPQQIHIMSQLSPAENKAVRAQSILGWHKRSQRSVF